MIIVLSGSLVMRLIFFFFKDTHTQKPLLFMDPEIYMNEFLGGPNKLPWRLLIGWNSVCSYYIRNDSISKSFWDS